MLLPMLTTCACRGNKVVVLNNDGSSKAWVVDTDLAFNSSVVHVISNVLIPAEWEKAWEEKHEEVEDTTEDEDDEETEPSEEDTGKPEDTPGWGGRHNKGNGKPEDTPGRGGHHLLL